MTGVYEARKKDQSIYYRVSLTFHSKHISLGSYEAKEQAQLAYSLGRRILDDSSIQLEDYKEFSVLSYQKFVILLNFRENGLYFSTPIYLRNKYFEYHLSPSKILKFDRDDLFFYASHTIQQRGGYFFVSDYGSQYKILGRYGVRPYALYGRDYLMANGDTLDYRYSNIQILNHYVGVTCETLLPTPSYLTQIHIKGNHVVGRYASEELAAIAYNKAVDTLHTNGFEKAYAKNYIVSMNKETYHKIYDSIEISSKLKKLSPEKTQ